MIITLDPKHKDCILSLLLKCDPKVGDTACQIRAIIFLDLYHALNKILQTAKAEESKDNDLAENSIDKESIARFIEDSIEASNHQFSKKGVIFKAVIKISRVFSNLDVGFKEHRGRIF